MSFLTKLPFNLYPQTSFPVLETTIPHRTTAHAMAWFTQLAYETDEPDKIQRLLDLWGFSLPDGGIVRRLVATPLPIAATELVVAQRKDATVVSFAGTDPLSLADWITDLNILITSSHVVAGFEIAFQPIAADLEALLDHRPQQPLFITGHSLGGALAVLAARHLEKRKAGSVAAVYTYGMPRAMITTAAEAYDQILGTRTVRCVYGHDIVPSVPPEHLAFQHIGALYQAGQGKTFNFEKKASPSHSNEPLLSKAVVHELQLGVAGHGPRLASRLMAALRLAAGSSWPGRRQDMAGHVIELLPNVIRDHLPDRYIAACKVL